MGKSKGQRTKGNLQPSSSAKAAELVAKTSGNSPGQLFILSKYLKNQNLEAEVSSPSDTEFCFVLKKLSKKDVNTKKKALQEFGQLCLDKDVNDLIATLPYWVPIYTKLSQDNDRWVRELCQESFQKMAGRVKNKLAPHLKDIMGTWLMAQCDGHTPCASMARNAFETLFREAKQSEAVWFCKAEIVKLFVDIMFNTTKESIKESDICNEEEIEGRLTRLQTASLDALSRFIRLSDLQYSTQVTESLDAIMNHSNFWKFHKHQSPSVRRAFFDLTTTLCDRGTFGNESVYREQVVRSVLLSIDESNPHVIPALWKACISVGSIKDCWLLVNMRKGFLPKLFSFLESGGHGCAEISHPNVVVLLDKLPVEIKSEERFSAQLLDKLRKGLKQSSVTTSYRESEAIVVSFVECCKYFVFNYVEKTALPNLTSASQVIKDQVIELLREAFMESKQNLYCSFRQVPEFIWYLHKMSVRSEEGKTSSSLWMHVFKTALDETAILSESLIMDHGTREECLEKLNAFYQMFLKYQDNDGNSVNQKSKMLKKGVTFDLAPTKLIKSDDQVIKKTNIELDIREAYKTHEAFKDFVHRLSATLYSEIVPTKSQPNLMKLFRMFFERFACEEFLVALKPIQEATECTDKSPEKSAAHFFLKDVVCSWMASAGPSAFPEVMGVFEATLCLESEEEQKEDFELALEELGKSKRRMYECFSLLFRTSNAQLIRLWTSSGKCKEILELSAVDCVDNFMKNVAHEESWNVLCMVLARNDEESDCHFSAMKRQLLTHLKEHLLTFMDSPDLNQPFDFIQILISSLLDMKSTESLMSLESFDWFLDALLWTSIGAVPGVSTEVCLSSRRTLILTLDVSFACCHELQTSFKDCKLALKIRRFLLSYVSSNMVQDYNRLETVLEASVEILKLFCIHFENFNFLPDFVADHPWKVLDSEGHCEDSVVGKKLIKKLSHMSTQDCLVAPRSERNHILLQVFYSILYNGLMEIAEHKAEDIGYDLEEELLNSKDVAISEKIRGVLEACKRDEDDLKEMSHIDCIMDCIGHLSFCSLPSREQMMKDLMSALDHFVPRLTEKLLSKLVDARITKCFESRTGGELNDKSVSLFILLKDVLSVLPSRETFVAVDDAILKRIVKETDANENLLKVSMATLPFMSTENVQEVFNKFINLIRESTIESEEHLSDSLLNAFTIVNAILSTDKKYFGVCEEAREDGEAKEEEDGEGDKDDHDASSCSDKNKTVDLLLAKIGQVREFCEGLFDDGIFNDRIARLNSLVVNFYRNVVSGFAENPKVMRKHWDEVLCFVVSRFEGLQDFHVSSDFEFSPKFESFLEMILSLILQMTKLFDSKEFAEHSPGLADEWKNVFQPTLYEYLNPFFIRAVASVGLKGFQHLNVLELLCDIVSRCPPDHFSYFHFSMPAVDGADPEHLFELLCPLLADKNRCVQVAAHALLKKLIPKKMEYLKNMFSNDNIEAVENAEDQEEDKEESSEHTSPAMYLPSLIKTFESVSMKFGDSLCGALAPFGKARLSPASRRDLMTYFLCFDTILDVLSFSPASLKGLILSWFHKGFIESHMLLLTSMVASKPSDDLLRTAHGDLHPKMYSVQNEAGSYNSFYSSVGCEVDGDGLVTLRRKVEGHDMCMPEKELEELSFRIFVKTFHGMPRIVRTWYSGLDQKSTLLVDKFVTKNVSPGYISKELTLAQQMTPKQSGLNFRIKTHDKELMAIYSADDATVALVIGFPDNAPLSSLKVSIDHNRILFVKELSEAWLFDLTRSLNYKDGTLTEALETLGRSLNRHFDGNTCMICFSFVLARNGSKFLPNMQCKTCRKKFHDNCLYTWFRSSNNNACPLCRSPF